MTNRPAPKCPYCGADMIIRSTFTKLTFWYECALCKAKSPISRKGMTKEGELVGGIEYAYSAAMWRAEPENRTLTLDEAKAHITESFDAPSLHMDSSPLNNNQRSKGVLAK